ncbi:MAG: hypothetical protein NT068_00145 [Candidatus Nomurabacteria bacterium]|nr:hypothetical protein [Candidatus Nomurabacteria bacterium]
MPVIKIFRSVKDQKDTQISELKQEIKEVVVKIEALNLKEKNDVIVLFPYEASAVFEGEQEEIVVEISNLFNKKERTKEVIDKLLYNVGQLVEDYFPNARVQCTAESIDSTKNFYITPDDDEKDGGEEDTD